MRFKAVQVLSQAELIEAQEQYAHQMASLETRAEATKDFLKPAFEWGKNPSLKYPDYELVVLKENYSNEDYYSFYSNNKRPMVSKQMAQDIDPRNPFLKELPIVQNGMKGNPLNTLKTNAVACQDLPEITLTRSSRGGMS